MMTRAMIPRMRNAKVSMRGKMGSLFSEILATFSEFKLSFTTSTQLVEKKSEIEWKKVIIKGESAILVPCAFKTHGTN